jgi:glycosyltransferase involved in cell wall biosynthesis
VTPLVSVIIPTWQRSGILLGRCIPSVLAQTYPHVECIAVSDGPDPELAAQAGAITGAPGGGRVTFAYLPEHDPSARWGHHARLRGIELASGDILAWLDDDNTFRPQHVSRLAAALEANPGAGFAYSQIVIGGRPVGSDPPVYGQIDTSVMASRREAYDVATWRDQGQETIDWDLAKRWMDGGLSWAFVPEITADWRQ